jgi:hypothetical protein
MGTKRCKSCGQIKDASEYYPRRGSCKVCYNEQARSNYVADKEKVQATHKRYYELHKKEILHRTQKYSRQHRDKVRVYTASSAAKHRFKNALKSAAYGATKRGYSPCDATEKEINAAFTGKCYVCGILESECKCRLHMDHCHKTGKFRGWLCHSCNYALGYAGDSKELLQRLIDYLDANNDRGQNS